MAIAAALLALGTVAPARAAAPAKSETIVVSPDEKVQKELAELEAVLNTNAKLEEALRTNMDQLVQDSFHTQNPEITMLIKKQPGVVAALKADPQFLLRRAIARLARSKVTRPDALALNDFLKSHPDIRKELAKDPRKIIDGNFLIAHPQLGHFFEAHPVLSSVLLQRDEQTAAKKKS
jgi:hypothetical protein